MTARMLHYRLLATGYLWLFLAAAVSAFASAAPSTANALAGLPLSFEPNQGKVAGSAQFLARGQNYEFLVAPTSVQFVLWKQDGAAPGGSVEQKQFQARALRGRAARMEFLGADRDAVVSGAEELTGKINYLIGNDPRRWRTGLSTYSRVHVEQLYAGINLDYYGNPRQLEYDFYLAPQSDPSLISIRFEGIDDLTITPEGDLVLKLGEDQLHHHRPALYQLVKGKRQAVSGGYRLKDKCTVGFVVGPYDRSRPLVIDPVFSYSTYFGGNGPDAAFAVRVDSIGAVYFAGATLSTSFLFSLPTNAFQRAFAGGTATGDAFVAKLDNTGSNLVYFTYLGGTNEDVIYDLALDNAGNTYVTGTTISGNFPTKNALFPNISGTEDPTILLFPNDAFVAELNTNGSALIYSTFLGGSLDDVGFGIAVDQAGYTYVTGFTQSTNFPVVNAYQSVFGGGDDAWVAKIAPGGTNLVYSTYLAGSAGDRGQAIAADENGFAYVTGYTISTTFPYLGGFQSTNAGGADIFVTRLTPSGGLAYSTYVGGAFNEFGTRIALDASHNAWVAGTTLSTNFPQAVVPLGLTAGNISTNPLNYDAILVAIDTNGNMRASYEFGGTGDDSAWGLALDASGRVFVSGITSSTDFPVVNAFGLFTTNVVGGKDVFVLALTTNATAALYSAYLGGSSDDFCYSIAVDSESSAYIAGYTSSTNFPTVAPFQASLNGPTDAFVAKIRFLDPNLTATLAGGNLILRWPITALGYTLQFALGLAPPVSWSAVPQKPVLDRGFYTVTVGVTNGFSAYRLSR
jgi:Beta-propeller repeat